MDGRAPARSGSLRLRHTSDLTDAEWALVGALTGKRSTVAGQHQLDVGEAPNAIFYALSTGWQRCALPKNLPPKRAVWNCVPRW